MVMAVRPFSVRGARLAEQRALAEIDRVIEQVEQHRVALDALDDQVDGATVERALERARIAAAIELFEQGRGLDLGVAEALGVQVRHEQVEVGDLVEREAKTELDQALKPLLAPG